MTTATKTRIKISEEVQPHFKAMWNTKCPYVICAGGRGSWKSSTISIKLVIMMKKHIQRGEKVNIAVIRENKVNLRGSVYRQIQWAIDLLHMTNEFRSYVSPMKIVHKASGSTFYFYGADKPESLKSNIAGNLVACWFEEFANNKSAYVFDSSLDTFIRQKSPYVDQVKVYCSYNPPQNPYDWVNEWLKDKEDDSDYFIDHSTYLDDKLGFTNDQQLKRIERYKKHNPQYYKWAYLGKIIGLGNAVYNMKDFQPIDKLPTDDPLTGIYYGMDNGYAKSASTVVACGLTYKGNVILLDTWYYSPDGKENPKAPSEIAEDVHAWINRLTEKYNIYPTNLTMDSADSAFQMQYYRMYGIKWGKVKKLEEKDMIDFVQDLLAQGRFYYLDTENNQIFIEQHRKYRWDEDTEKSDKPKVIKKDDHTCDAFKYDVVQNRRDFGLQY